MKKTLITLMLVLALGSRPASAFNMKAPIEQVQLIAQYVKQVASIGLYTGTIEEAVAYIKATGDLGANAAREMLSAASGMMEKFQSVLHFSDPSAFASFLGEGALGLARDAGMNEWADGVSSSVSDLKDQFGGAVQQAQNTIGGAVQQAKDTVGDAVQQAQGAVGSAVQQVQETAGNIKQGIEDSIESVRKKNEEEEIEENIKEAVKNSGEENSYIEELANSDSSADKVIVVTSNFGQGQNDKKAAQQFIRSRYFYSTKKGDKYDGEPLTETSQARKLVLKNRIGYQNEMLASSLATAYENSTKVKEESYGRLEALQQKMASKEAKTFDGKKAVEALIVQEEARQRMIKLNLDITMLEMEVVAELQSLDPKYIIARTPEQIEADTNAVVGETKDAEKDDKKDNK